MLVYTPVTARDAARIRALCRPAVVIRISGTDRENAFAMLSANHQA